MLSLIRYWLQPPVFPGDENKTRVARTLHVILLISLVGVAVYTILLIGFARGEVQSLIFAFVALPLILGLWYSMRKGYVYIASALLVSLAWLNLTVAAIADGYGIRGTSLLGYILIVITAGLLINGSFAVVFALLNITSGLILVYLQNSGLLPEKTVVQTDLTIWTAQAVFSISAALVLRHALESLHGAIQRASLSESYYRMLFEEAPEGILIVDGSNRITMANAAIYQITGYLREEIIGRSPLDFVAPEDLASRPPRPLDELKITDSNRRERVLVCKDGSRLNVIIGSTYMPDGRFQYIIQDITDRKRMEAALRASEEKFAKSFQSSPDAITISTVGTGKFIEVNDGFCHMSGYTREETLGRSAEELNIWEDVNDRRELVTILQRDGNVRDFETTLRSKTGKPLDCLLSVEAVEIGGQWCMLVVTRDVTERKRMEEELRLSEERYRLISSVISDYIFSIILDEKGELHLNWVAGAFERITGFTIDEFNNRGGWLSILHPDDQEKDAQDTANLMNNRRAISEIRLIHKDGSIRWVRSYGHPVWDEEKNQLVGIYGAVQDITEQKQIEQELRLSEQRYRLVSSVISDYTFSNLQNEKGEIVLDWVAGAFEKISGYTFEEFNARGGWVSTVHPDDLEQDARDMEILRHNQQVISELRTIHKDGGIHWVRSYAHPIWDARRNQLVGIYGAVQDITDRKRIEQDRENLISDLEAKNQELEQFTYTVSHDLKAPIITIKGFLGFIAEDALSGNLERLRVDIRRISEAADKMHRLLNDLLELSRIGRLMNTLDAVAFEDLVNDACAILQGRLQENRIEVLVKSELPFIYGDPQRLLEVVQNLMDNAAKFIGDQRHPIIEIGQLEESQAGFVTLYVRDNGIGIAPQFHERIFGLFNRLDPNVEGTGVGLALVKRIVEFHGGRIWVESEPGQGATFFFTLPGSKSG